MGRFRLTRREVLVLLAILALAAVLRLPGLDERGRWDADQGHDMLVLRALVQDGEIPLLGPPTSIATFHHGAAYYYLLAPSAILSGADPVAVTGELALLGIAAVAATWWLARLLAGPTAGLVAGLLIAVSPAAIDESTFIWNPNPIPLASALAYGCAIRAWQTRRPAWWLGAAVAAMFVSQLHVLGIVAVPPLAVLYLADVRRRLRGHHDVRPLALAGAAAVAILAIGWLPLAIYELTTDFAETRALLEWAAAGGRTTESGISTRLVMIGLRAIAWPAAGVVTDRPALSMIAVVLVALLAGIAALVRGPGRRAVWWLLASVAWSVVALVFVAPSLAIVTPGLPNDHYHAFLDPIVATVAGVGLARLWHWHAPDPGPATTPAAPAAAGRITAAAILVGLIVVGIAGWPPPTSSDGGWALVDAAAARVRTSAGLDGADSRPTVILAGIPPFKSADALRFPLERRGVVAQPAGEQETLVDAGRLVIVCDPLFEDVVGLACGGPAEDAWLAEAASPSAGPWRLLDRFGAGERRVISVYAAEEGS